MGKDPFLIRITPEGLAVLGGEALAALSPVKGAIEEQEVFDSQLDSQLRDVGKQLSAYQVRKVALGVYAARQRG